METNVNYTLVGAFVIGLITAIILSIIWLSSGLSLDRINTYAVYMQESVAGLNVDSQVEYNGVNVGSVKSIELDPKNTRLVQLLLDIKATTPITRGTVATLTTRGLTGVVYIALHDKSNDNRPIVKAPGQRYPVIPTAPSIFTRLDAILSTAAKNFDDVSRSVQALLDKENLQSFKQTLNHLEAVSANLEANNRKLNAILINTERATHDLGPLLTSSKGAMKMLETQTLPAAYELINNLNSVSQTLNEVATEIKQNPSVLVRGAPPPELGPGEKR